MDANLTCEDCGIITPRKNCKQRRCPECVKNRKRIYNHNRYIQKTNEYKDNARKQREKNPSYSKQWNDAHIENMLLHKARYRAKEKKLNFDIDVSDIVIPAICPVLGIPLVVGQGAPQAGSPTLDRIVPSLGYIKGNIQVISHRANKIKNDASLEELMMVGEWARSQSRAG